jgi:hypothetical protein
MGIPADDLEPVMTLEDDVSRDELREAVEHQPPPTRAVTSISQAPPVELLKRLF